MTLTRILVADDEQEIRTLVTDVLEEAGYAVQMVGDGLSALAAIRADPPALALLDVTMPMLTGDETLQQLRTEGSSMPVILMTAGRNRQGFTEAGATAVLPKPFELEQLLMTIAQALTPRGYLREVVLGDTETGRSYGTC